MTDMEKYIREQIDCGYIAENGTPLKCQFCDSKELETFHNHEDHILVEKLVYCKSCNERVGDWNYGSWSV